MAIALGHPLVVAADLYAASAHAAAGQLQKYTGLPYTAHTRAVTALLARYTDCPASLAASHLHDVLEDTCTEKDDLVMRFGPEVASLVDEVTKRNVVGPAPRSVKAAAEALRIARISPAAKNIKCADVVINISDIVARDARFARTYVPEKRALLPSLAGAHPALLSLVEVTVARAELDLVASVTRRSVGPRP